MKKINIIDLDNTLLPYDSMSALVLRLLKIPAVSARVFAYSVMRKLGMMDRKEYFARIARLMRCLPGRDELTGALADRFFNDLRKDMLDMVAQNSDADTINVLCTASPSDYALKIAQKLGWDCVCSNADSSGVLHAYGPTKKAEVQKRYPAGEYAYNLAVSDSESDLELLKMFAKYKIV